MSVPQQIVKELEEVPPEAQEKILRFVRFLKKEFLYLPKKKDKRGQLQSLSDLDNVAVETGISDLAEQHDHYLSGILRR